MLTRMQTKMISVLLLFIPVFLTGLPVAAQETNAQGNVQRSAPARRGGSSSRRVWPRRVRAPRPQSAPPAQPPVALVNKPEPDYLSGEANVQLRGNQNPIIRLGLAQNGVTIVEFPAADRIYYLHPGNSDLVTVDDMRNKETEQRENRFLVFRAGASFVAPQPGLGSRGPSASIMAQMQSGMVITFLIYPVRELAENAHRCVVMYNRDEVIAARRAAGLPVNLDGEPPAPARNPTVSVNVEGPAAEARAGGETEGQTNGLATTVKRPPEPVVSDVESAEPGARAARGRSKKRESKPAEAAYKALMSAVNQPARFTNWSAAAHGLSLALAPAVDLDERTRLVVVAVRNDSQGALRILPSNPEIFAQTFDDSGKPLQIEQVKRLHVETTALGGQLAAGQVAYYAIVYEAPILGARQRLRVSVGQWEAADEPANADLRAHAK